MLKAEKAFAKIGKKQAKECETMTKKHKKEREAVFASQSKVIEKLSKTRK